jgi:hypothetical protein
MDYPMGTGEGHQRKVRTMSNVQKVLRQAGLTAEQAEQADKFLSLVPAEDRGYVMLTLALANGTEPGCQFYRDLLMDYLRRLSQ